VCRVAVGCPGRMLSVGGTLVRYDGCLLVPCHILHKSCSVDDPIRTRLSLARVLLMFCS